MTITGEIHFEPFAPEHLDGSVALAGILGWASYAEPGSSRTAFSAPGAITWVALIDERVIGLVHLLTNGVVHAHLSLVGVLPEHRRVGVATRLITEAFHQSGAKWLDLWSEPAYEGFYRSFRHQEHVGFRIYPSEPC